MKNKLTIFFLIFFIFVKSSFADQFKFETSEIKIEEDGKTIYAKNGKAISLDGELEIEAEKFKYSKNLELLKAFKGTAKFKSENLKIQFEEIVLDQKNLITTAKKNIKIIDIKKNISAETDQITYDKQKKIIESSSISKLKDNFNNILITNNFSYNLNDGILKLKDATLQDFNNNFYSIELAYLNTITNKLIGKDIEVNLNNESFNKDNEPRIKGRSIVYDEGITEIKKGVFTTCKKRDSCPPWQLSASKINHDKTKKIINYENAFLKVYDIPIMYFPKFFHPDPTVDRKSGFLIPSIKNSPKKSFISVPYFAALSQNKDMTLTPRFYSDNKFLLQTEYRQNNKESSHIADFGILEEKDQNSKTHLFYTYKKLINLSYFEESNLTLNIEKTSNDTYLKGNKLASPLINNFNILENNMIINLYSSDLSINSEIKIYENLDKSSHDRFEYIFPKVDIIKKISNRTMLDGNFLLKSNNFIRNYATNIFEKVNINNFIFNSNPKITKSGFYNNYDFILKNVNSVGQKSNIYQEDDNFYFSGIFQFNSSLPLVKEKEEYLNIFKPKISLKISPSHTKDLSTDDGKRLDVNNIYNIDRLSFNDTIEGGISLTYGNEFSVLDQKKSREVFSINLANNLRLEENEDLPRNNQIGSTTSNFFGEIKYSPNEFFKTKYNGSTRNNLTDINYENLVAEIKINNFFTTFDYLNDNYSTDKNTYLTNTTGFNLNENNSLKFSTRENKSSNLTEYYKLIYEYKNDCLAASVEYNKDYYDDRDVKPEENILFKLTIIPLGETSSPNLKN